MPTPSPERIALIRDVSPDMGACELSYVEREPVDVERARMQHAGYREVLERLGCEVIALDAEPSMPDAVFVEDTAVVVDELAVMTRPGAASRRAEGASIAPVLARFRPLRNIEAPGTIDGGDVLCIGRQVYVGQSHRTNAEGIAQLRALLAPHGYTVTPVPLRDCLHLKSAVTAVSDTTVLLQPDWTTPEAFAGYRVIEVDPSEPHAANVLRIGDSVVMPASFPRTRARLEAAGIDVVPVALDELQKAEGATTCCSIVFARMA